MLILIIMFLIFNELFFKDRNYISVVLFQFIGKCLLALATIYLLINFTVPLLVGTIGLAIYMIYFHYTKRKESNKILGEGKNNDDPDMPKKPKLKKLSLGEWIFILVWFPIGILFYLITIKDMGVLAFIYLVLCGWLSVFLYYVFVIQDYNKKMSEYEQALQEYENLISKR